MNGVLKKDDVCHFVSYPLLFQYKIQLFEGGMSENAFLNSISGFRNNIISVKIPNLPNKFFQRLGKYLVMH